MSETMQDALIALFRIAGIEAAPVLDGVTEASTPTGGGGGSYAAPTYSYTTPNLTTTTPTLNHGLGHYPQVEVTDDNTGERIGTFTCTFPSVNSAIISLLSMRVFTVTMI